MIRPSLSLMPIFLGLACNPVDPVHSDVTSIIGENTQVEVDGDATVLPEWLRHNLGAVGVTNNDCTVFHVGGGVALSAGHCFSEARQTAVVSPCEYAWIRWNYRRGHEAETEISRCLEVIAREHSPEQDFAIIRVDPAPQQSMRVAYLELPDGDEGHGVLGHPGGGLLQWSEGCKLKPGQPFGWGETQFAHECDTLEGNSGSPIIRLSTQEVVGIHNGGDGRSNYGTLLANTPLQDIMAAGNPQYLLGDGEEREFGPFDHNARDLLAVLGRERGERVSFGLAVDVEKDYDQIILQDGLGVQKTLSGQFQKEFENLATPVIIIFVSDYAGPSRFIRIGDVSYR